MKGSGFVNALGFVTGVAFMLLGMAFIVGGSLITGTIDSVLQESSAGLRTASDAIRTATEGVAISLENGSCAGIIVISSVGLGVLMLLAGLYQISAGIMIRKLVKGQVAK